ncbi:MAG TPA: DUF3784 domain-containing protein [Candidatus Thermoplasmatota archaeon]|nr:DUF3784 domain-containing protein [Candidatus Thermoplasmatota archaeon]
MWIINLLSGLFVFFLGLIIRIFKMSFLIAGYNTASKEEKKKYDEEKLIKYVSNLLMISSAFIIIGSLLSIIFDAIHETIIIGSWLFFTVFIIGGVIYLNVSGCVKK